MIMAQEHIYNLQIGEYILPDECTIKRVGKIIHVYKKLSKKLPSSEKRCRDRRFFGKGHTVHPYYLANVCLKKPKQKEGFFFSTFPTHKICEKFENK